MKQTYNQLIHYVLINQHKTQSINKVPMRIM